MTTKPPNPREVSVKKQLYEVVAGDSVFVNAEHRNIADDRPVLGFYPVREALPNHRSGPCFAIGDEHGETTVKWDDCLTLEMIAALSAKLAEQDIRISEGVLTVEELKKRLAESEAETKELRSDIDNAVRCAKEYCPDYPWTLNTASEAVWATGEAFKGVGKACDDWRAKAEAAEAETARLRNDVQYLSQFKEVWSAIFDVLHEVSPGWCHVTGRNGRDNAVAAIRSLERQLREAREALEKTQDILRSLEWTRDDGDEEDHCVFCMVLDGELHTAGCQMAQAILDASLLTPTPTEPPRPVCEVCDHPGTPAKPLRPYRGGMAHVVCMEPQRCTGSSDASSSASSGTSPSPIGSVAPSAGRSGSMSGCESTAPSTPSTSPPSARSVDASSEEPLRCEGSNECGAGGEGTGDVQRSDDYIGFLVGFAADTRRGGGKP